MSANRVLTLCCCLAAMLSMVRMACVRGVVAPVRVDGSSMAGAFLGARYVVQCRDCGLQFPCDPTHTPLDQGAVCFNCGFDENPLDESRLQPGQRVWLDELAHRAGRIRRWDVVAFRLPGVAEDYFIKRVVGLPGERVQLRHGDVFADGRIQRKSFEQFREMAMLVHDDRHRPRRSTSLGRRWDTDAQGSSWRPSDDGYVASTQAEPFDWLTYRNWACAPDLTPPAARDAECPVNDNYSIDQRLTRGWLNEVSDLALKCRIQCSGAGRLALRLLNGRSQFQLEWNPEGSAIDLLHDGRLVATHPLPGATFQSSEEIEFAVCDQRVLLAINGREIVAWSFEDQDRPLHPTSRPLAIGVSRLRVEVRDLQVFRDVHYLHPRGDDRDWATERALGAHEVLVLGDNSAASIDSRVWNPPGLDEQMIWGKVIRLRPTSR